MARDQNNPPSQPACTQPHDTAHIVTTLIISLTAHK